jgi:hypothetical protein
MAETRIVSPTGQAGVFRNETGALLSPPTGWMLLPPGDAALTRRVKAAGEWWQVVEKKGRKTFSHGLWAPIATIEVLQKQRKAELDDPRHGRRLELAARRRAILQDRYVEEFTASVQRFLRFSPQFAQLEVQLAQAVAAHATPVGSGTVARTKRIGVEKRAEAAVIAWLRHQTTAYDSMRVPRIRGRRREVRRELAAVSCQLLDLHRQDQPHPVATCPLCRVFPGEPRKANQA